MKLNNDNIHLIHFKYVLTKIHFINIELLLYLQQNRLKMKKTILLLSIIALIYSCEKQEPLAPNTYEITVTAKGVHNGMRAYIKLFNDNRKEVIIDTAIVINEAFSFKGKVNNASMRVLTINSINGNVPFILEPGKINIEIYKDSIYSSKVGGSKNNEVYNLFKAEPKKKNKVKKAINNPTRASFSTRVLRYKAYTPARVEKAMYDNIITIPRLFVGLLLLPEVIISLI